MCGPDDDRPWCSQLDVCPVFKNTADQQFCPRHEASCERQSGLPTLLARCRKVSPSDSVELKIAANLLKLHTTISRLKETGTEVTQKTLNVRGVGSSIFCT